MPLKWDRDSVDDVIIPVKALVPQGANPDTTSDVIQFAFTPGLPSAQQRPTDDDWHDGFWLQDLGQTLACITIGPATAVGAFLPGSHTIWLRVRDDPTTPMKAVDTLTIT